MYPRAPEKPKANIQIVRHVACRLPRAGCYIGWSLLSNWHIWLEPSSYKILQNCWGQTTCFPSVLQLEFYGPELGLDVAGKSSLYVLISVQCMGILCDCEGTRHEVCTFAQSTCTNWVTIMHFCGAPAQESHLHFCVAKVTKAWKRVPMVLQSCMQFTHGLMPWKSTLTFHF